MSALCCRAHSSKVNTELKGHTYHASPSFILTIPSFGLRSDVFSSQAFGAADLTTSLGSAGIPSPLISTFLFIAAVAEGDRSLAITYLHRRRGFNASRNRCTECADFTRGISFA